jgi:hypothetical protein
MMACDFWGERAFNQRHLPQLAHFADVPERHPKSTRFLEGYWRRRDDAPAAAEQHRQAVPRHHFRCTALSCRYVTVRGLVLQRSCRVIVDKSSTNP